MRIERVLAPNPGPFTLTGTNTWLLDGGGEVIVIDPGPVLANHRDAIVTTLSGRKVIGILVTHTHSDHAPLANPLARELEVPALGYAVGPEFDPDLVVVEGEQLTVGTEKLNVLHTPGHSDDHLCFLVGKILFTGDHIIGGSSAMVEDLSAYLQSLNRLRGLDLERLLPGHGPEIEQPLEIIDWYLAHRQQREAEILAAVMAGASTVEEVVEVVYRDVDGALHPLAARSVVAHLNKLTAEGRLSLAGAVITDTHPAPSTTNHV
ncbi:MAG TPA: MBL fold metallo-hydrolase [Acidimicrobiia bacterium]|nr:MBL fold metallo-hydrolase [Acidimicrobiia bacterium]